MIKTRPLHLATGLMVGAYLVGSAAGASELVSDDLITSSNLSTPWQACGDDSAAIDVSNLDAGGCAYRTTPVEAGITYSMTCGIQVVKYASITLAFLDADDNTLATDVTEVFEHVTGAYSVKLQAPSGTTTAAIGIYGEAGSGFQDCVLIDATPLPEPTKGSIGGITWFDEDNDSLVDGAEDLITGTPVTLNYNGAVLEQTTTGADGAYYFGNLDIDACYTVTFGVTDSTVELGASGGDNDAGAAGTTDDICLTELVPVLADIDAAFVAVAPPVPPADLAICGAAWVDANSNGTFERGDATLSNVSVTLIDPATGSIQTIETDAKGNYVFADLTQGDYQIQFGTPDGHEPTASASGAQAGTSYINADGVTPVISLPADNNSAPDSACSIQNVNGGFIMLPVALAPTVANDDAASGIVGVSFSVSVLGNDMPCDGAVNEINLLGHNVPGSVAFNASTNEFDVTDTTAAGTYSIEYGLRGACGSYDTASVVIELSEPPVVVLPNAPEAPVCRVETGGSTTIGGVDVFNPDQNGFASQYNMYDRDKNLVVTVASDDYTHKYLIGNGANQWEGPWEGNWEIEWNGTNFGYNQVSVYYVAALENGLESVLTECVRSLVSPIALDLQNQGRIQRIAGNFEVDLNNDGIKEALSQWFAPSAGILVNKHASGKVSGTDMFGNVPGVYTDGFAELATLDVNEDGQLNNSELNSLAIWNDLNSDTMVDANELSSLADHNIVSLATTHYKFMARAKKSNGKSILMEDVWLPHAPMAALAK